MPLILISSCGENAAFGFNFALREKKAGENVAIYFLQDGVLNITQKKKIEEILEAGVKLYVLEEDAEARGLSGLEEEIRVSNYPELVDVIMEKYDRVLGCF